MKFARFSAILPVNLIEEMLGRIEKAQLKPRLAKLSQHYDQASNEAVKSYHGKQG